MALSFKPSEHFIDRHLGPDASEREAMLQSLGLGSMEALVEGTVPASIRLRRALDLPSALSEAALLEELAQLGRRNQLFKSFIGMGYSGCITPTVILRNVLENPGWYTAYTPYQAEIAQGRLEALLNFQQMVVDLTGLEVANASLLDEATAAAEAMHLLYASRKEGHDAFFVSEGVFPQTLDVLRTRAGPLGIEVLVGDARKIRLFEESFRRPGAIPGDGRLGGGLGLSLRPGACRGSPRRGGRRPAFSSAAHPAGGDGRRRGGG